MIKVAVCQWFPPTLWCQGGGEIHAKQYIRYLNKLEGVEAFRFCPLTEQDYNILHIIGTNYHLNEIGKYARLADKKVVITPIVYNPRHPYQYRLYNALFNAFGIETLINTRKEMLENSDIILANTLVEKTFIQKAFGIESKQIDVVGVGVAVNDYKDIDDSIFREKYGLNEYVLSVGRVTPLKRQLDILDAARSAGVPLVLIGPPDQDNQEYLLKVEEGLKESRGVWIRGLKHNSPELLSAYKGSLCHVLFSTSETAGLVNLEAIGAGTIVVTCPHKTVKEIIHNHGVYVNSTDDLKSKINMIAGLSSGERERHINKAREYVIRNHSWEKVAKETMEVYKRLQATT